MRKIDQLKQLQQMMEQDRKTVEQICADWGWTLSDSEATIVNQIVINKGKVTAIETTKEDNSTIEMLRETIRQMNANMNDVLKQHEEEIAKLKGQYEQQMLDMTSEFEYECECIAEKRDKEIARLKAENEQLKNDFIIVNNDLAQIEVNYELIKKDLSNKVDRIDELEIHVEELQGEIDMLKEELQYFDGKEEEYNNDVTGMEQDIKELRKELAHKDLLLNEFRESMDEKVDKIHELEDRMEGMKIGYENRIAQLKSSKVTIEVVDDPLYNDVPEEKPVVKNNNTPSHKEINLTYTSLELTHDAIKAVAHDKVNNVHFHFVWAAGKEKLPSYSASGARGTWSRMTKEMYPYAKQIIKDFQQLADERLLNKTKDNKVKTTKVKETKVTKDVVDEQEIVVNVTNDKHVEPQVDEDPLSGADEMEFW